MARIGQVGIMCGDLEQSLGFYRDMLGLEEFLRLEMGGRRVIILRAGNVDLELIEAGHADKPLQVEGRSGLNHFAFFVRNLEEVVADLRKKGIKVISEPKEAPKDIWGAFVEGPDGVRVELVEFTGRRVGQ